MRLPIYAPQRDMPVHPRTLLNKLTITAGHYPIVIPDGPRQFEKTTLTQAAFPDKTHVTLEPLDTRDFAGGLAVAGGRAEIRHLLPFSRAELGSFSNAPKDLFELQQGKRRSFRQTLLVPHQRIQGVRSLGHAVQLSHQSDHPRPGSPRVGSVLDFDGEPIDG
jgi:hypothetical protein